MKFIRTSIFTKIWLSISILILGYIISMIVAQRAGTRLKEDLSYISSTVFPAAMMSQRALNSFEKQVKLYEDAVMLGETELIDKATAVSAEVNSIIQEILSLNNLKKKNIQVLNDITVRLTKLTDTSAAVYKKQAGEEDLNDKTYSQINQLADDKKALTEAFKNLTKMFSDGLETEITDTLSFFERQSQFSLGLFIFVLIVSLPLIWFVARYTIVRPIQKAVARLIDVSDHVASSSGDISVNSQSLAQGANEQAASVEETSSSMEELAGMTRNNADNAQKAQNMTSQAVQIVSSVNTHMKNLEQAIGEITHSTQEAEKVIKLINEIAFQTNLLALNAAVEAARAGDAGAGFAVVADEVRNLAMRAAAAAEDTSQLMSGTVSSVKNGSELVQATIQAFHENVDISESIRRITEEILAASQEQAHGIEQINSTLTEIGQITQSNSSSAQKSAEEAHGLELQVDVMSDVVTKLEKMVKGQKSLKNYRLTEKQIEGASGSKMLEGPMEIDNF